MATKLFVGSLPFATTGDQLKDIFSKAGDVVEANIVMDKMTGRSRGFGFVEMATEDAVKKAIADLNGSEVDGRKIFVAEARPSNDDRGGAPKSQDDSSKPEPKEPKEEAVAVSEETKAEPETDSPSKDKK
jgi:RNA recognition motif-containing protein